MRRFVKRLVVALTATLVVLTALTGCSIVTVTFEAGNPSNWNNYVT